MKREEVLRALADRKRVRHCMRRVEEFDVYDWHALATERFVPEHWDTAAEPVPPGDLTYEEAQLLYEKGAAIQVMFDCKWCDLMQSPKDFSNHGQIERAYRRKPVEKAPEPMPPCRLCGSRPRQASTNLWSCSYRGCGLSTATMARGEWINLCLSEACTIPPKLAEALRSWRSIWPSPIEMAPSIHSRALVAAIDAEPLLNQDRHA